MAATSFPSVVLGYPEIASMVFEFQFGVYEDVRPAFRACNELVEFDARKCAYACDPSFRQAFAPNAVWSDDLQSISPHEYALRRDHDDPRLPLHLAVAQGFVQLTKRILGCRPDLASDDAIILGFQKNQLEIVELLLDQSESARDQSGIVRAKTPAQLGTCMDYWGNMLAREDSKGILLLQRFGLYPNDVKEPRRRGDLEDVCFLHEHRKEGCTVKAMDDAAANGHLEVVQFLHFNRTEGCTIKALDGASPNVLDKAAANGRLEIAQYLHSLGTFDCTVGAVDKAAANGHLEIVEFLLTNRSEGCTHDKIVEYALGRCQLRTAEYLLSRGPATLDLFELLVARGQPIEKEWLLNACFAGNLPLFRFLHAHANPAWRGDALDKGAWINLWDTESFPLTNDDAMDVSIAAQILQRQPELRHEKLLEGATAYGFTKAIRFLLDAGIGNPRECLVEIVGRPMHVTASKLLLPHCMDATKYLDNILYLLDLLALPSRRRKTTLRLITCHLLDQGRKASQTIQLAPSVAARASTLLEAGEVVDWALALVIGHRHATDSAATIEQLEK
ncbi:hypothetical protein SPRG_06436 [Saprolegnia parasitica CBS 223.65]|uniref:Uncharacterized protein n=1 Tax=Saprolegnia parasitica (strain CBS 223.65) TaxID=695850 RepID=A0A067CHB4_SAPPC|nr:hypothetical protein SPRG_06436 [Saprolegnia parasitica CBS 223.65]KDO28580.1 hypothetical protein SPRG_06436 [Saprolegnia parasitica CBS 223.65]|eukprot:XP_012200643.1 hypothetical protein SPRG_06436 [Saprolegnia parasitica CBS 223.65]